MPTGYVSVAWNDGPLVAEPTWDRIDDAYPVQSITVDRGRAYETETTDTGTCTIQLIDRTGDFDPTNNSGAFYSNLFPMRQVCVSLPSSTGSTWSSIFRGYVAAWRYEPHPTQQLAYVTIECVDLLDLLASAELMPTGGYATYSNVAMGNVVYAEDLTTTAVQTRIEAVLNDVAWTIIGADWPTGLKNIFTGNVKLWETVYAPRTSALEAIRDAADAEFPHVSNFFINKDGVACFRGRYSRFNYTDPQYNVDVWDLGDLANASTTVVPIVPPLVYVRDKDSVYSASNATYQGIDENDQGSNYSYDSTARATYGLRTWAAEYLQTAGGAGGTQALDETFLFALYVIQNYNESRTRVSNLTVKSQPATGTYGAATWDLLQNIEINDVVTLTTTSGMGSGGFAGDTFFVEGLHYDIKPMSSSHPEVTLGLDVSPESYYSSSPFLAG